MSSVASVASSVVVRVVDDVSAVDALLPELQPARPAASPAPVNCRNRRRDDGSVAILFVYSTTHLSFFRHVQAKIQDGGNGSGDPRERRSNGHGERRGTGGGDQREA